MTKIPPAPTEPSVRQIPYIDPAEFDAYAEGMAARDAAQTARIAELEADQPTTEGTLFGVNGPEDPALEAQYEALLDPDVIRYYFQVNETPVFPLPKGAWPLKDGRVYVISMKKIGITVSELVTFFRQLPTDRTTYVCGWHEPADQLGIRTTKKPVFTKAQYDALYVRIRQAQQQVGDHIQIIPILEGIAFYGSNNPDAELPADPSTYDVVGADPYYAGDIGQPIANLGTTLDKIKAKADSLGKPWAVCETGVGQNLSGQARNDALHSLAIEIRRRLALFAAYFLGSNPQTVPWRLDTTDGSRDAWVKGQTDPIE